MRGIFIDPYTQTIREVDTSGEINGATGFYELLGAADPRFSNMVERVGVGGPIDLWIDEEAHLSDGRPVFELVDAMHLGGAALLLAHDEQGESQGLPAPLTLELAASKVRWTELVTTGDFEPTVEKDIDHPVFGKTRAVIQGDPIFRASRGYFVFCEDEGVHTLATSAHFRNRADALAYAATVAPSRKAEVREANTTGAN